MQKSLLLDVDEVICFSGFVEAVNDFLKTNYVIDDFTDYYIDIVAIPKDRYADFNKFISERNMYKDANILPNAVDTIKKLNEIYKIYILSSCIFQNNVEASGRLFKDKYDFLTKTLPFIEPNNFIFTSAKYMITADIMIDDRVSNLTDNFKTKILFPSYHNKDIDINLLNQRGIIRAGYDYHEGWMEVEKILIKK